MRLAEVRASSRASHSAGVRVESVDCSSNLEVSRPVKGKAMPLLIKSFLFWKLQFFFIKKYFVC